MMEHAQDLVNDGFIRLKSERSEMDDTQLERFRDQWINIRKRIVITNGPTGKRSQVFYTGKVDGKQDDMVMAFVIALYCSNILGSRNLLPI